jgi:ABC-type sugar transport system substrate-binding protein
MKKALAILLVLIMAISLFACGKDSAANPPASGPPASSNGSGGGAAGEWPAEAGYFDPDYDYTKHERYKVGYLITTANFLYDEFDKAFNDWAARMNINYTGMWAPSANSADEYLSGIQTFIDQGYDGLLLDPDTALYPRIVEMMNENPDVSWVGCLGQARNYSGDNRLYGPNVGFNNVMFGMQFADKLMEWKDATWPDVPWDKVGLISVDFSLSPQVHERALGAEMRWAELHPEFGAYDPAVDKNPKNYWIVDTATGNMDQTTAQNLVTQILSNPGEIEVWLIATAVDDYSMGAANAAENLHLTDKTCSVCSGGSNLVVQMDNGQSTAWRYALFTAQSVYAEPIIGALWAFMSGQATPDTLWPDWANVNDKGDIKDADGKVTEEHFYACLMLPTQWIDKDNYKSYLEWTDLYAYGPESDGHYGYEKVTDLNLFSARSEVPASYKTPAAG